MRDWFSRSGPVSKTRIFDAKTAFGVGNFGGGSAACCTVLQACAPSAPWKGAFFLVGAIFTQQSVCRFGRW